MRVVSGTKWWPAEAQHSGAWRPLEGQPALPFRALGETGTLSWPREHFRGRGRPLAHRARLRLRDRPACGGLTPKGRLYTRTSSGNMRVLFCLGLLVLRASRKRTEMSGSWVPVTSCCPTGMQYGVGVHRAPRKARMGESQTESPCDGQEGRLGVIRDLRNVEGNPSKSWAFGEGSLKRWWGNQRASLGAGCRRGWAGGRGRGGTPSGRRKRKEHGHSQESREPHGWRFWSATEARCCFGTRGREAAFRL